LQLKNTIRLIAEFKHFGKGLIENKEKLFINHT